MMIEICRNTVYRIASRLFALRHCVRGTVAVELAFFVPVAAVMIMGAIEFGRLGLEQVRIASAARAGAQYGIYDLSSAADIDGMIDAARLDADDVSNALTVAAGQYCRCSDGTVQACSIACSDGKHAPRYIQVTVSEDVALWFSFPGIPATITLAANSNMRLN